MSTAADSGYPSGPIPQVHGTDPASLVLPPSADRLVEVWPEPVWVPEGERPPSWWLIGAHGGAGVSMLASSWSIAGDAMGAFPGGFEEESPFLVVVARESAWGLDRAHDLLTQHLSGYGGAGILLGLVTVAAHPGKIHPRLRQRREVIGGLVDDRLWRIPWIEDWISMTAAEVPVWTPATPISTGRKREPAAIAVPREVAEVGADIRATILDHLRATQ
ncbi:hypothetical protein LRL17_30680 (plasmid) [Rhodococcus qingshengii]|uniref:hypothetical protein n=1 Tax=Rhodococcus qingshengii TaxID=334542 RepID=UPI001E54493A|nr:hypothetical protein [Rhodococcus qingshengii]UGQ55381.1 hypothetical protein LRL17_30680 [Rhodococcus qingshengii]